MSHLIETVYNLLWGDLFTLPVGGGIGISLMAVLLRRMGCEARIVQGTFLRADDPTPVEHAWVYAVVNGTGCWFDPLYGGHFAENPRDYFMADDARMALTHQWNAPTD